MTRITDPNTNLVINIEINDRGEITEAAFCGPEDVVASIARQLIFLETTTYASGQRLRVGLQNISDNLISITENTREALLFIAKHLCTRQNYIVSEITA